MNHLRLGHISDYEFYKELQQLTLEDYDSLKQYKRTVLSALHKVQILETSEFGRSRRVGATVVKSRDFWQATEEVVLETLLIHPDYRNKGFGTAALEIIKQSNSKISVYLTETDDIEQDTRLLKFFSHRGFKAKSCIHLRPVKAGHPDPETKGRTKLLWSRYTN